MKRVLYISLVISLFFSCEKRQLDDCITSRGPDREEVRALEPFSQIRLSDKFEVIIEQSDSLPESVTLQGGMNLFPGIDTKVEHGVLVVEDKNTCNFVRTFKEKVKLTIRIRKIDRIDVHSVVKIKTNGTLNLDDLVIVHTGLEDVRLDLNVANEVYLQSLNSGGLILSGFARKIKGSIEEISQLDARDLTCEQAFIDSHTRLDCYINPTEILFVKIYNEGNIWYRTEPSGIKEVNVQKGTGQLLKL